MRLLDFMQLSTVNCFSVHCSIFFAASAAYLARRRGFEPPTFWSVARRSIQLSYRRPFASILAHYKKKHNSYCIENNYGELKTIFANTID